jgi:hypothetical protein
MQQLTEFGVQQQVLSTDDLLMLGGVRVGWVFVRLGYRAVGSYRYLGSEDEGVAGGGLGLF